MVIKWKKRWINVFLFLLFVPNIFVSASTHRSRGGDFRGFLVAGERFLDGTFLYHGSSVATNVTWPPFFSLFIVPFTLLARISLPMTQVLWYITNAALLIVTIDIWCRISYRKPLGWFDETRRLSFYSMSVFIPLVLITQPIFKVFVQLQLNVLILFLLSLTFFYLQDDRECLSGLYLGFATALKAFPILVIPYLAYRRKSRTIVVMALSTIVLTMLPALRYGAQDHIQNLAAWFRISLSGGYPLGGLNQSAYAMIARWIASDPFILMKVKLPPPPVDGVASMVSMWVFRGMYVSFVALFLLVIHRCGQRIFAAEAAFMVTLCMVFSPIAWQHYWILTLPAYFVLHSLYEESRSRALFYAIWASFVVITVLSVIGQTGKIVRGFLLCVTSHLTIGAFILMFALLYGISMTDKAERLRTR